MSHLFDLNWHPTIPFPSKDLTKKQIELETYLAKVALTNVKFQTGNDKIGDTQP